MFDLAVIVTTTIYGSQEKHRRVFFSPHLEFLTPTPFASKEKIPALTFCTGMSDFKWQFGLKSFLSTVD
jgi:hypothetical protein